MKIPITTGIAASVLDSTEPRLNDLIRRKRIIPQPPVVSGRRIWGEEHLRQAADALGIADVERRLAEQLGHDEEKR